MCKLGLKCEYCNTIVKEENIFTFLCDRIVIYTCYIFGIPMYIICNKCF